MCSSVVNVTSKASSQQEAISSKGFWGIINYTWIFDYRGRGSAPNAHILQGGSAVLTFPINIDYAPFTYQSELPVWCISQIRYR